MKVAGLFAGIGGIELGLRDAGHDTVLLCDNDAAAAAVLSARFPDTPLSSDVAEVASIPEEVDLLSAGFPCQDLSQAGRTKGIAGSRSGLVSHVFRLLEQSFVPWVLIENVPFMLHLDRGAAMEHVVSNLERLNYRWAYRVVDTRAFGLPQRRRRVYLLASKVAQPDSILFRDVTAAPPRLSPEGKACGFYWTEGNRGLGWAVDAVPTLKGGSGLGIPSPPAIWLPDGRIVVPDIRDAERIQGFQADWTSPAEKVARATYRWKLVGNAVSVPAARWIGELLAGFQETTVNGTPFTTKSWPDAAYGSRDGRYAVATTEWPRKPDTLGLEHFLQYPSKPLSLKAARGFMTRLERSQLRYPSEFMTALRSHVEHSQDISASVG